MDNQFFHKLIWKGERVRKMVMACGCVCVCERERKREREREILTSRLYQNILSSTQIDEKRQNWKSFSSFLLIPFFFYYSSFTFISTLFITNSKKTKVMKIQRFIYLINLNWLVSYSTLHFCKIVIKSYLSF